MKNVRINGPIKEFIMNVCNRFTALPRCYIVVTGIKLGNFSDLDQSYKIKLHCYAASPTYSLEFKS